MTPDLPMTRARSLLLFMLMAAGALAEPASAPALDEVTRSLPPPRPAAPASPVEAAERKAAEAAENLSTDIKNRLADELDAYLKTHVLAPRFPRCIDAEHGGFHTNYARDWSPLEDRTRFIVYQARVVWTAATVARLRPETRAEYVPYVRHGVRYLADVMWDRERGGFHTYVDLTGRAVPGGSPASRPVYGQAFAVYALAAAHAATGDAEPLDLARRAWRWIEDHYRDDLGPGYRSAVKRDGTAFDVAKEEGIGERESIEGPAVHRTMNDHIHLLEAYAELLHAWPDPVLRTRTEELLAFVRDRLFVEPGCLYTALRPDGRPVPAPVSFGHDVETAFLMIEAEEALGRAPLACHASRRADARRPRARARVRHGPGPALRVRAARTAHPSTARSSGGRSSKPGTRSS